MCALFKFFLSKTVFLFTPTSLELRESAGCVAGIISERWVENNVELVHDGGTSNTKASIIRL